MPPRSGSNTPSSSPSCTARTYDCNEHCKYYTNIENAQYKFIPMVHRTYHDGRISHVSGIVNRQWLRVYMRSKMIKHNKDLFESRDDPLALLDKLHIY